MVKCGGCGREIDTADLEYGARLLCDRCYHLQVTGPEPPHTLSSRAFIVLASLCLTALAAAGFTLCALYFVGTEDLAWFIVLAVTMSFIVGCPAAVLTRKRNLALLIASLYLPLGIWAYLWYLSPGAGWEYSKMTAYGGFFFFTLGLVALGIFIRDLRALPRL